MKELNKSTELYALTRKAADTIFEYDKQLEDRRKDEVNPYYHQTQNGVFMEMYYGHPSAFWTPWGQWRFGGSSFGGAEYLKPLLERFGATVHKPEVIDAMGQHGPIYALHKVDDIPLPEPVELDRAAYVTYEVCKEAWKELTEQYNSD
jgi:hypothetical protein